MTRRTKLHAAGPSQAPLRGTLNRWLSGFGVAAWLAGTVAVAGAAASSQRLAIVAPEAFHDSLKEFIAYKQQIRPVVRYSLEEILQTTSGADDPEKLKRFLYHAWREEKLHFVLLVGDGDILPVRYMVLDRKTPAAFNYAFYPSDLYYADLANPDGSFNDWNARKESFHADYFGEVRGEHNKDDPINYDAVDYLPDIAVGRWPVSRIDEVALIAAKTITYETAVREGTRPELRRAAFLAVGGWVDTRRRMDRMAAELEGRWTVEKRYYRDNRYRLKTASPTRPAVRSLLNEGLGLAVHTGHGRPDRWEQCFYLSDLDRITNAAALPVVVSAGCSTAYFAPLPPYEPYVDVYGKEHRGTDHQEQFEAPPPPPSPYQRGRFNPTGLGEQMLKRGPQGGVAYIGCNTGSQPCGVTLVEGFIRSLAAIRHPTLGDCWTEAIRYYHEKERLARLKPSSGWYPPSIFFQGMKFMVFGDPSVPLPGGRF